jgi:putative membrane protein
MLNLLLQWIVIALGLMLIAWLLPGVFIANFVIAMLAALVVVLINQLIRPVILLLTLPINILTLGLFVFIINAILFSLAAWLVPGFVVTNFWNALLGSLLLSLIVMPLSNMWRERRAFR